MKIVNKQETLFHEPFGNRVVYNSDQLKDLYSFILSYVLIYRDHYLVTCTVVSVIRFKHWLRSWYMIIYLLRKVGLNMFFISSVRNLNFFSAGICWICVSPFAIVRVQRDLNPRPAAPQAAILSKLNYGPPATDNFSIYELPFATQQRLRATPLHKVWTNEVYIHPNLKNDYS